MGRFLGGIIAITVAAGQPLPNLGWGNTTSGYSWSGPRTVYPGHTSYYGFLTTRWRVPVTCSASGNTCNTAGSGYTPTGNETNVYVTATTPPTGMDTMAVGVLAPYDICQVSGTTFKLCRHGTSTVETFSSTGTAVSILFVPASTSTGYIVANTGWPSGTVLTWAQTNSATGWLLDAFQSANGNPTNNFGNQNSLMLKADIPTSAAPGDYTINIIDCTTDSTGGVCTGGLSDTLTFTITVTALAPPSDANEATSFPAITGLSTWVNYMSSDSGGGGGGDWCNKTTGATTPANQVASVGVGIDLQFYDGPLAMWRIGNFLGDPGWKLCTQNVLQQIAWGNANSNNASYIYLNNGGIQGFQTFPIGYEVAGSQDPRYVAVNQYLAGLMDSAYGGFGGNAFAVSGCNHRDALLRENSYGLDVLLAIDRMGLTPVHDWPGTPPFNTWAVRRKRCADEIIGSLNAYLESEKRYETNQYFITGLALDTLIHWWQATKDPRVPMVVKATLDQYWSHYNQTNHKAMWNPDPNGVRCLSSPTWWVPSVDAGCQNDSSASITTLHNLFGHAFAWYWRISGNDIYRTEGDEVFSHSLDFPALTGKGFSQMYRYSFNYVGWRQGWLSPEKSIE